MQSHISYPGESKTVLLVVCKLAECGGTYSLRALIRVMCFRFRGSLGGGGGGGVRM